MSGETAETASAQKRRKSTILLAVKLLVAMIVVALPVLIASIWVPGVTAVAFFGVLAATFGWMSGGARVGMGVVASLAALGVIAVLLREHTWILALMLILLGILYGYAAGRGVGKMVLQLPILVPYFMLKPPALFRDPPVIDLAYVVGVIVVMLAVGLWTILILQLAAPGRKPAPKPAPKPQIALLYGTILGLISAAVMVIGTTTEIKTHWVWITLTLYVLADPQQLYEPKKMFGRVLGTIAGFTLVTLVALVLPAGVMIYLAVPALWLCVVFMLLKKPYWQYTLVLTAAVILMDTSDVSTLLLDAERLGFTIVGAGLSVIAAFLVNFVGYGRLGLAGSQR